MNLKICLTKKGRSQAAILVGSIVTLQPQVRHDFLVLQILDFPREGVRCGECRVSNFPGSRDHVVQMPPRQVVHVASVVDLKP